MRSVLPLMLGLVVGCAASAGKGPDGGKDVGKTGMPACTQDEDCPDGFCDTTGLCGVVKLLGHFGWPCTEFKDMSTDIPLEIRLKQFDICAAYRCMDGRCRSCRTAHDCYYLEGLGGEDDGDTWCTPVGFYAPDFPDGRRCSGHPPDGGSTQ